MVSHKSYTGKNLVIDLHGWENSFADFYYHTFDEEVQENIEGALEEEEIEYIKNNGIPVITR